MNLSDILMTAFGPSGGSGRTGALDLNQNPEAAGTMPPESTGTPKDAWDRLGAQLEFANQIATVGRGMYNDLSTARGPAASPLLARPAPVAPYQPSTLRLSDIAKRR